MSELQLKLDKVNLEMMALNLQMMLHWEGGNDISSSVKNHLPEMIKRVMDKIDNGPDFGSSGSLFSSLDMPASADAVTRKTEKDLSPLSDTREHCNSSIGWLRSQQEDSQAIASIRDFLSLPLKVDVRLSTCLEISDMNLVGDLL